MKNLEFGKNVIKTLKSNDFDAYFSGECVIEIYKKLPLENTNFTIITSAYPEDIIKLFKEYTPKKLDKIGLKYLLSFENSQLVIILLSTDSESGHPSHELFTVMLYDYLKHRDFTAKALLMDESERIIDLFDGYINDLKENKLKFIGDWQRAIDKDPHKLLRMFRYKYSYGMDIADISNLNIKIFTKNKMLQCVHQDERFLTPEIIKEELFKLLGDDRGCGNGAIYEICSTGLLDELDESFGLAYNFILNLPEYRGTLLDYISRVLLYLPQCISNKNLNIEIRMAGLMCYLGYIYTRKRSEGIYSKFYRPGDTSAEIAKDFLRKINCSNKFINNVSEIITHSEYIIINMYNIDINRALNKISPDLFIASLDLAKAKLIAQNNKEVQFEINQINSIYVILNNIMNDKNQIHSIKNLDVNGNDIISILGVNNNFMTRSVLDYLLNIVMSGLVKNEHDELLKAVNELKNNMQIEMD